MKSISNILLTEASTELAERDERIAALQSSLEAASSECQRQLADQAQSYNTAMDELRSACERGGTAAAEQIDKLTAERDAALESAKQITTANERIADIQRRFDTYVEANQQQSQSGI